MSPDDGPRGKFRHLDPPGRRPPGTLKNTRAKYVEVNLGETRAVEENAVNKAEYRVMKTRVTYFRRDNEDV